MLLQAGAGKTCLKDQQHSRHDLRKLLRRAGSLEYGASVGGAGSEIDSVTDGKTFAQLPAEKGHLKVAHMLLPQQGDADG